MKRILFALILALFACGLVSAQLSDVEVAQFVLEQHEAGKSQTAILIELQRKGVKKRTAISAQRTIRSITSRGGGKAIWQQFRFCCRRQSSEK